MPQRLTCFVNVECAECGSPLVITFEWPRETPPASDGRIRPGLLMCPCCRNPFAWPLPEGMLGHAARLAHGAPLEGAVAVPFLQFPKPTKAAPSRAHLRLAGAALPAVERLQYLIWTAWPALYALVYLRQC